MMQPPPMATTITQTVPSADFMPQMYAQQNVQYTTPMDPNAYAAYSGMLYGNGAVDMQNVGTVIPQVQNYPPVSVTNMQYV